MKFGHFVKGPTTPGLGDLRENHGYEPLTLNGMILQVEGCCFSVGIRKRMGTCYVSYRTVAKVFVVAAIGIIVISGTWGIFWDSWWKWKKVHPFFIWKASLRWSLEYFLRILDGTLQEERDQHELLQQAQKNGVENGGLLRMYRTHRWDIGKLDR